MIRNTLKIAIRQLFKQRFYSLLNVAGLALGVTCCLLIMLYIRHELSYDQYHENADELYRVALDINLNQSEAKGIALPPPLARTMRQDFPEVVNAARLNPFFFNAGTNLVRLENAAESSFQEKFVYVDHSFTEMFDFPKIYGNPENWLKEPFSMVLTRNMAERFFPGTDPTGQTLVLNNDPENQRYTVTGVVENLPANSHLEFDFFLSMTTLDDSESNNWVFNNYHTYVQLKPGTDYLAFNEKLLEFGLKYFAPQFREQMNIDLRQVSQEGSKYDLFLQPLSEVHLHSDGFMPLLKAPGDIRYVQLFAIVALFLLLIGIVNFVNLATARSANRAKEVGVRKVLGSVQYQLIWQFIAESVLLCIPAFLAGLLLAELVMPFFNKISGKDLVFPYEQLWFLPSLAAATVLTGILAGLYPAFYLSGFSPIKVLKGHLSMGSKGGWLRKGLVVFQFTISAALIIGTLVVFQQVRFIYQKKIGFDKDQVLLIHDTYTLNGKVPAFKEALKELPEVKDASSSGFLPLANGFRNSMMFAAEEDTDPSSQVPMQVWTVDTDYLVTLGMELVEGRNFSATRPADSLSVILNQTAIRQMGITDPLGKRIKSPFDENIYQIIGIVEDFNFETLKEEIGGLGLFLGNSTSVVAVKANTSDLASLINKTETIWQDFAPQQSLRYTFLDERFDQMYDTETRAANLFNIFAVLSIIIACLGLFGLATFTAEQRSKEIGIRKILGASVSGIISLLSREFLQLVVVALLIASPLAYYLMNRWLENFVYHIEIRWWVFLLAGLLAVLIAFVTVSLQSIKAALSNPVQALRNE